MKHTFLALLMLISSSMIYAQMDTQTENLNKKNQILFSASSITSYSLIYSKKLKGKSWLDMGLNLNSGTNILNPKISTYYPETILNNSVGIKIGFSKRKMLSQHIELLHGFTSSLSFSSYNLKEDNPSVPINERWKNTYAGSIGLGYRLGIYYLINDEFAFGCSLNPELVAGIRDSNDIRQIFYSFNVMNLAFLSFRFSF